MIITKIVVQNYRSLKAITIDDLKQFNVFIGKNGSGKSHILEALELFFADLNLLQQTEKGFEENLWFDRENTIPIQFKIQLRLTEKQIDDIFTKDILKTMTVQDGYKLKTNELMIEREISGNRWNNKSISLDDWELVKDNTILNEFPESAFTDISAPRFADEMAEQLNMVKLQTWGKMHKKPSQYHCLLNLPKRF